MYCSIYTTDNSHSAVRFTAPNVTPGYELTLSRAKLLEAFYARATGGLPLHCSGGNAQGIFEMENRERRRQRRYNFPFEEDMADEILVMCLTGG